MVPAEYLSWGSMAALGGAAGAVFVIINGIKRAFGFEWKPLPLLLSAIIVFAVGFGSGQIATASDYILCVINSFVLYAASAGGNEAVVTLSQPGPKPGEATVRTTATKSPPPAPRFISSWFHPAA